MGYKKLHWLAAVAPIFLILAVSRLPYPVVHNGLLLPLWCAFIMALAAPVPVGDWLWKAPWMMVLGEASYGIYILQQPVSNWLKLAVLKATGQRLQGDYPSLPWLAAYCVILIVVSVASFYLIEHPSRAWIRRKLSRPTT